MITNRLVFRGMFMIGLGVGLVSCATTPKEDPARQIAAPTPKKKAPLIKQSVESEKPLEAALPPVNEIPKVAFLADANTGRSGAFNTRITVFARGVPENCDGCQLLTVVYDGKPKGPEPLGALRTSHARIDFSEACAAEKPSVQPKKLTTIGATYHSPSEATFALRLPNETTCTDSGLVKVELLGLKCSNINLQMCMQLEVRESLSFSLAEMKRLLPLAQGEYPNKVGHEQGSGILQAKTH